MMDLYRPTVDDRLLWEAIAAHVREFRSNFEETGHWIDQEYSPGSVAVTNPKSVPFARLVRCGQDLLEQAKSGLCVEGQESRLGWARRILLLHVLLNDPDLADDPIGVSSLEEAPMAGDVENPLDRDMARDEVIGNHGVDWFDLLRHALANLAHGSAQDEQDSIRRQNLIMCFVSGEHADSKVAVDPTHPSGDSPSSPDLDVESVSDRLVWDTKARTLFLDGVALKSYGHQRAENQVRVLDSFQSEGWPSAIDFPIPTKESDLTKKRSQVLRSLSRSYAKTPIRFKGDGTGEKIRIVLKQK